MKTTADARRRVTLPKGVRKGDTFEIEPEVEGRFVLVKLERKAPKAPEKHRLKTVRRGGRLLLSVGRRVSVEETLKAKEDAL